MKQYLIDLHSHILPGLDDGARSLGESLEMALVAWEGGTRIMVATPHCMDDRREIIRTSAAMLREVLQEEGIPLRLLIGMEIFGTPDTARRLCSGELYTLNNSRYPLIEFDFQGDGGVQTEILQRVIQAGYTPLVAHPERYAYVQEDPEIVNRWKKMGCLFQVNRGSLLGRFGEEARSMARDLTCRGFATAVASDAHAPRTRTPWMKDVSEYLERKIAPAAAWYLLSENPRRILKNLEPENFEPEWF